MTHMNQKAHITGGILLAAIAMIAGTSPLTASLIVFGGMFNDLDCLDIPWCSRGVHRKLLHNIYVIGLFAALSAKFSPFLYFALGVCLHDVMDLFSGAPVYLLWPLPIGEHGETGGWGVPNKSMLSFPVGIGVAASFSAGYITLINYREEILAILQNVWEHIMW